MATIRQQLLDLIETLSPNMEKAFRVAIDDVKSEVVLKQVVEALERRDIDAAVRALHIEQSVFRPLAEAIRQAFNAGGDLVVNPLQPTQIQAWFQMRRITPLAWHLDAIERMDDMRMKTYFEKREQDSKTDKDEVSARPLTSRLFDALFPGKR